MGVFKNSSQSDLRPDSRKAKSQKSKASGSSTQKSNHPAGQDSPNLKAKNAFGKGSTSKSSLSPTKVKMTPPQNTQKSSRKPGPSAASGATPAAKAHSGSSESSSKKVPMDPQHSSHRAPRSSGSASYSKSRLSGFSSLLHAETVCREVACEGLSTSGGYCRLHYIKNWKKIKRKEVILQEKKLDQYIEELVLKYPDKYIEAIRLDLASDKEFAKVIYDLDLDETVDDFDAENAENVDSLIDTIKRDFDDDSDAF